jgi:lipoprotein-anchoring transpeptidase ErfK/SrfK
MSRRVGLVTATAAMALATGVGVAAQAAQAAPAAQQAPARSLHPMGAPRWATVPPSSAVVIPKTSRIRVYAYPTGSASLIDLKNPLLRGVPLVFAQYGTPRAGRIPVSLPVRPNNTLGWVVASQVRVVANAWRIDIYRKAHKLLVWQGSSLMGAFTVAIGKPSTPTPSGVFYVLQKSKSYGDYGPWLMPTSGFSDVYQTFGPSGGDAAIAIHGTNVDSSVGQSMSHGCIRLHNADVALIAPAISVGTLVRII